MNVKTSVRLCTWKTDISHILFSFVYIRGLILDCVVNVKWFSQNLK